MSATLSTARGAYAIEVATTPQREGETLVLTLSIERADGIERFGLRCRIEDISEGVCEVSAAMLVRIAELIGREFEQIREAALKSIRTERKLFEIKFDSI